MGSVSNMAETSNMESAFEVVVTASEQALRALPAEYEFPTLLWFFWENGTYECEMSHGLDPEQIYALAHGLIIELCPDAVCLVSNGWTLSPPFPDHHSQPGDDVVNIVICDRGLQMKAALMPYRRSDYGGDVDLGEVSQTYEVAGRQADELRKAIILAHNLSAN